MWKYISSKEWYENIALTLATMHCATFLILGFSIYLTDNYIRILLLLSLIGSVLAAGIGAYAYRVTATKLGDRLKLQVDENSSHRQLQELFSMTDMLQAADNYSDAGSILTATARRVLPGYGGALYIFNNSRDRLDLTTSWDGLRSLPFAPSLIPNACWAMKRGKPHINDYNSATLCCDHHTRDHGVSTVEIPMIARGGIHGLLVLSIEEQGSFDRLISIRRLGRALADSMSLALSNITLRETLRTQSLRDPLTGLYNRRYMEDALDRSIGMAAQENVSTSVIMIDLDNFKKLNDRNGHAKGDIVLRDVARQLTETARPTDIICRYGGEEILVVMPNCALDQAAMKAEEMRHRIAELSNSHNCEISASFGVASIPETSISASDLLAMADASLYEAKTAGRNCVRKAAARGPQPSPSPRLAAIKKH